MGVVTKAYTTTIVAGLTAYASNVRRALDDIYDEFNGGINSNNISSGFTHPASAVSLNDTAANFSSTVVEGALIEIANGTEVQDFTVVKSVGEANQQMAGHTFSTTEPGTTASELIALYLFDASATKGTDEVGTYTLAVCNADVVSGIMGASGGALSFSSETSSFAFNSALGSDITGAYIVDCWIKPEQISAGNSYVFEKRNDETNAAKIYLLIDNCGNIFYNHAAGGGSYNVEVPNYFITGTGNDWTYIVCAQDTSNGARLWINGNLMGINTTAVVNMVTATGGNNNFFIGCNYTAANPFKGYVSNFRVRKKVAAQKDIDLGYATKYNLPKSYANLDYTLEAIIKEEGCATFTRKEILEDVARESASFYRYGICFGSSDYLKIIGKV